MKEVHISDHPLVRCKLTLLRDKDTSPRKFRDLLKEITVLLAYEACQDLKLARRRVSTPLADVLGYFLQDRVGLVPILRAGLGMADALHELMPDSQVWHLGIYRDEESLEPVHYYSKLPVSPTVEVCLVLDPMLATGGSAISAVDMLKQWGATRIKFIGIIGAPEGIQRLTEKHPDVPVHLASVDEKLNDDGYILPGLGDAGDRQFGTG